jgi:TPR repeat protein/c-di-GMP-related signal transduction protein
MFTFLSRLFSSHPPAAARPDRLAAAVLALQDEDEDTSNLVVLRKVVLTRDKKVAGYEFFQPDAPESDLADPARQRPFLRFLASVLSGATLGKRRAFAAVAEPLLFDPALEQLARAGLIVLVRFGAEIPDLPRTMERMLALRQAGLMLGLADARVALAHPALGDCVSLGFLPVDQILAPDLLDAVRLMGSRHPRLQLCASGVNSNEEFEVCRRLRMVGFIGPFATHRRDWQDKRIDPGTARLCKLVNSLRAGAEMEAILHEIKLDPLLSYRILCYANSAAIGAQRKILALKDAILLIGREPLFRWLVLLLCASAPSQLEDSALLENALARGRMMELLANQVSPASPEDFFLTGVLSLLDVILQLPPEALFDALDLPEDVRAALLERKGPYAGLLRLAEASEQSQADGIQDLCAELGIEPGSLGEVQSEALTWARGQTQADADERTFVDEPPGPLAYGVAACAQPADAQILQPDLAPDARPDMTPHTAATLAQPPEDQLLALAQTAAPAAQLAAPQSPPSQQAAAQLAAAQRGEPEAQCALAARYAIGEGVAQDLAQALAWYTEAAQQGNPKAQWNLAVLQARAPGASTQATEQAAQWCQKAADQGFAPAQATLGLMYAGGQGVDKDLGRAQALLQQAATQGDAEAQYNLAVLFEQGLAGAPDLQQACDWFTQAANQGLVAAQERLGLMYATGHPMAQDLVEAHKWFLIASGGQHEAARANLAHSLTLMDADQVKLAQERAARWTQAHGAVGQSPDDLAPVATEDA